MIDLQKSPSEIEIAEVMSASKGYHADIIRRLAFERDSLRSLLDRFRSEVRMYCRPGMVQYDVFPVFKEVDELFAKKKEETDETS